MASFHNSAKAAALNGITALLNSGSFRVLTSGSAEIAAPVFNSTAFGAATSASPSVATANALTQDSSLGTLPATMDLFEMRNSAGTTVVISGSIGTAPGDDIQVADATVPGTATSFNITGLSISLQL